MLSDFVDSLFNASSFDEAFSALEKEVLSLGFDGVLYTFIPQPLIDAQFHTKPVFAVSKNYCPQYLQYYTEARYDRFDPLIQAVSDCVGEPFTWWGAVSHRYRNADSRSDEVIEASRHYGIQDGITIPLMCDSRGVAGASVISESRHGFDQLLDSRYDQLLKRINLFHTMVVAKNEFAGSFVKPLFATLSKTEIQLVSGLAAGKNQKRISADLNRSEKYLEQVMLSARRKMSGVGKHDTPTLNRNQLLYYAGLLCFLDHESQLREQ